MAFSHSQVCNWRRLCESLLSFFLEVFILLTPIFFFLPKGYLCFLGPDAHVRAGLHCPDLCFRRGADQRCKFRPVGEPALAESFRTVVEGHRERRLCYTHSLWLTSWLQEADACVRACACVVRAHLPWQSWRQCTEIRQSKRVLPKNWGDSDSGTSRARRGRRERLDFLSFGQLLLGVIIQRENWNIELEEKGENVVISWLSCSCWLL